MCSFRQSCAPCFISMHVCLASSLFRLVFVRTEVTSLGNRFNCISAAFLALTTYHSSDHHGTGNRRYCSYFLQWILLLQVNSWCEVIYSILNTMEIFAVDLKRFIYMFKSPSLFTDSKSIGKWSLSCKSFCQEKCNCTRWTNWQVNTGKCPSLNLEVYGCVTIQKNYYFWKQDLQDLSSRVAVSCLPKCDACNWNLSSRNGEGNCSRRSSKASLLRLCGGW